MIHNGCSSEQPFFCKKASVSPENVESFDIYRNSELQNLPILKFVKYDKQRNNMKLVL